jgi:hypothetical protein
MAGKETIGFNNSVFLAERLVFNIRMLSTV